MSLHIEIESLLIDIEAELRRLQQWQVEPPSPEALASTEPFCVDTLTLPQWLQFIFLPRMRALLDQQRLPPGKCGIAPLAEEYFRPLSLDSAALQRHLVEIDRLISGE
jgi:uncharacterized protein YqcC (DUF446 family)